MINKCQSGSVEFYARRQGPVGPGCFDLVVVISKVHIWSNSDVFVQQIAPIGARSWAVCVRVAGVRCRYYAVRIRIGWICAGVFDNWVECDLGWGRARLIEFWAQPESRNTNNVSVPLQVYRIRHRIIEISHEQSNVIATGKFLFGIFHLSHVCVMMQLHHFVNGWLGDTRQCGLRAKLLDDDLNYFSIHDVGRINVLQGFAEATGHQHQKSTGIVDCNWADDFRCGEHWLRTGARKVGWIFVTRFCDVAADASRTFDFTWEGNIRRWIRP